MSRLLDWAQVGQQQFGGPQAPVNPDIFNGGQLMPTWQGNTLNIPGLGGLLQAGVGGFVPTGGNAGAGGGAVTPGGGGGGGSSVGGGSIPGGGGVGGGGGIGGNANVRSDILTAFNNLTDDDRAYLAERGYNPRSATSYQDYIFATYGR